MNRVLKFDRAASSTVKTEHYSDFHAQNNFEHINHACQGISVHKFVEIVNDLDKSERRAYEAAMWEGWPLFNA